MATGSSCDSSSRGRWRLVAYFARRYGNRLSAGAGRAGGAICAKSASFQQWAALWWHMQSEAIQPARAYWQVLSRRLSVQAQPACVSAGDSAATYGESTTVAMQLSEAETRHFSAKPITPTPPGSAITAQRSCGRCNSGRMTKPDRWKGRSPHCLTCCLTQHTTHWISAARWVGLRVSFPFYWRLKKSR